MLLFFFLFVWPIRFYLLCSSALSAFSALEPHTILLVLPTPAHQVFPVKKSRKFLLCKIIFRDLDWWFLLLSRVTGYHFMKKFGWVADDRKMSSWKIWPKVSIQKPVITKFCYQEVDDENISVSSQNSWREIKLWAFRKCKQRWNVQSVCHEGIVCDMKNWILRKYTNITQITACSSLLLLLHNNIESPQLKQSIIILLQHKKWQK